jgi:hypothetical protein
MQRRQLIQNSLAGLGLAAPAAAQPPSRGPGTFQVSDFRAKGDGKTLDTKAIQAAIDACHRAGGGAVFFPAGKFLTGTIVLKDNVVLHLSAGTTLLGSQNTADYIAKPFPALDLDVGGYQIWALVYAENARNIGIEGKGTIDGNGKLFVPVKSRSSDGTRKYAEEATSIRPRLIFWKGCRNASLRDVRLRDAGMWTAHFTLCEGLWVQGIDVYSDFFVNQDGIVIDSCRKVFVTGCTADTEDDAVVLKASYPQRCEDIVISDCVLTSRVAAIKFGTQSLGGFRNVSISNCTFFNCQNGGLKFFTVDGGDLEDITVSNIAMNDVSAPIFFRRGNRGFNFGFKEVPLPRPVGRVRNILVSGIRATVSDRRRTRPTPLRAGATMGIAGLPGYPVEDVVLENIHVTYPGGGTLEEARRLNVPERENAYPENTMFGVLPAYGMYIRHAKGVTVRDLRLEVEKPDFRPALIADDVDGLEIHGLRAGVAGGEPLMRLRDTRHAWIQNCKPSAEVATLLAVHGAKSTDIALSGSDLRRARAAVLAADGFAERVAESANFSTT